MLNDYAPVLITLPKEVNEAHIYPLHDVHIGSPEFDQHKLNAFIDMVLNDQVGYVCIIGDMMDNAVVGSKGDVYTQTMTPHVQREATVEVLRKLGERVVAVVPGNHENNRTTARVGLYPLYDACVMAGCEDKYRQHFAVMDIAVGTTDKNPSKQQHYTGYLVHKAKDQVNFGTADMLDGFDFMLFGHDHRPMDKARGKLVWDAYNKKITRKTVECINCGSMLAYDGYAADGGYRIPAEKMYMLKLYGGSRQMRTEGFCL